MRISDWSSDVCSSDLRVAARLIGSAADLGRLEHKIPRAGRSKHPYGLCDYFWTDPVARQKRDQHTGFPLRLSDLTNLSPRPVRHARHVVKPRIDARWSRSYQDQPLAGDGVRSEEHTSELQSLMRISYAVFCLKKKTTY